MCKKIITFKHFVKKNSLLLRILLSYIVIGSILITIFSYILINIFSKSSIDEINNISEKMLFQSYNTADILLISTYSYFYQLFNKDSTIFNAMYTKTFNRSGIIEIDKKFTDTVFSNPLVYSIYIYNSEANLMFSSLSPPYTVEEFYDQDAVKLIKEGSSYTSDIFIPRKVNYKISDKSIDENLISIIYMEPANNKEPDAAMVLNINQKVLQEMVTNEGDYTSQAFIINSKGFIISHSDPSKINRKIANEGYIKKILSSGEKKGHFTYRVDGSESLVTYVKSDRLGWSFIGVGEYEKLIGKVAALRKYIFLITGIFLLIGILIALFFTSNIYTPLYRLLREIRSQNTELKELQPLNEYDYLANSFYKLANNLRELKTYVNQYAPAKKKEVLRQIIHGEIMWSEDYKKNMDKFGICLESPLFIVVVLKIDSFKELCEKFSMEDIALFRFAISNVACELLETEFKSEAVEDEVDHVNIIMNIDNDNDDLLKKIQNGISVIQLNIEKYMKFTVTAAVGNIVNNVKDIRYSYKNALQASAYRMIYGKNSIILYSNVLEPEKEEYEYPFTIEKRLMDSLKLGDVKKVNSNLGEFFEFIKKFNIDEVLLSLTQLALMSVGTAKSIIDTDRENINLDYKITHQQLSTYDTLDEIKEWFMSLYKHIVEIRNDKADGRKDEIVKKLITIINKNYHDSNISVEMMASNVNLSTNYVRTIFKETTNQSISNYITELRFKKAQELLKATTNPAKKIAEMVGFSDSRYFYIAFRKFSGKTPEEYRNSII